MNKAEIWEEYNRQFGEIILPMFEKLNENNQIPVETATDFNNMLSKFLEEKSEVKKNVILQTQL